MNEVNPFAKLWVMLIKENKKDLTDVPTGLKEDVEKLLKE